MATPSWYVKDPKTGNMVDPRSLQRATFGDLAGRIGTAGSNGTVYYGSQNPPAGGSGSGSSSSKVEFKAPDRIAKDRAMMSQADWQSKYGNINFDAGAIRGIFDSAVNAEYAAKERDYAATERKFYDQLGTQQNSLLASRRQAAAQNAVQTGANRGMQNAMLLTDTLQQSAETAPGALALAEGRRALIDQKQAALTLNAKEAEALAEQRKLDYAKVGSEVYATDAQKYVGELGYDATALEQSMTKYGIDASAARGGGGSSGKNVSSLLQYYSIASANNDPYAKSMASQALMNALIGVTAPGTKK